MENGKILGEIEGGWQAAEGKPSLAGTPAGELRCKEGLAASSEKQPSLADIAPEKPNRQAPWLRQYAFKPGVSGNPKGRPRLGEGGKQDYRKLFREQMNQRGADVVKACLDKAAAGDTKMIAIAMRYLMPEAKADSGNIDLELAPEATMEERLAALVNKISTGDVSVEAGSIAARSLRDITESAKTLEALQRMDAIQAEMRALDRKTKGF